MTGRETICFSSISQAKTAYGKGSTRVNTLVAYSEQAVATGKLALIMNWGFVGLKSQLTLALT